MEEEKTIWKGSSSQVVNLGTYVLCGLFFWLVVPIFIWLWKWIENRSRVYEVTTERIKITSGIFTKRTEEWELYRVNDSTLVEPFWYRQFGAGNVVLTTNDVSNPTVTLEAIKDAGPLREEIRKNVEICRQKKRVRIAEME
ncbi:MAG TPA: PH domain-containing protein [Clostridia bacterium]|nr:PH domain-containing protein [Clostridia bacterium]